MSISTSIPENILRTVSNTATVTISHQYEIEYSWFAVHFFARDLHQALLSCACLCVS